MRAGEMERAVAEFCGEGSDNAPARRRAEGGERLMKAASSPSWSPCIVVWLLIAVVKIAFKLLAVGIAIAVAVVIYFAVEKMIGKRGG